LSQRVSDPKKYIDFILSICPEVDNFSLLHGDLWFGNSLLYQGKRYFIDFEKGIFGDKEFDFANTYYEQSLTPEILDTIVESLAMINGNYSSIR
jgi:fructosamine-3-kinase